MGPGARSKMPNDAVIEGFVKNPLLIDPDQVNFVASALAKLSLDEEAMSGFDPVYASDDFWGHPEQGHEHPYRPYAVANGVLQIPVQGVLLNRFSYAFGRWATGYTYIERALARGLADPNVRAIALVVDSPGGDVAGNFELADKLFAARSEKPLRAFAADHAYSAAYSLASAASEVVVTRSGGTGSIGVVTAHMDMSEALANYGVKITFIFAGKHKVDGNPYEPLPEAVKDRIQSRIDRIYGVFVSSVARNRNIDEDKVRGTEALTYDAADSISNGLADKVGALDEELVIFANEVTAEEEEQMTTFTQEQLDAAVSQARAAGVEDGKKIGAAEGAAAERTRVTAIMTSDEAKTRPVAARALADAGIGAAEAKVALAAMPEEGKQQKAEAKSAPKATAFERMMATGNPEVGAVVGDEEEDEQMSDGKIVDNIFGSVGYRPAKAKANA
jgi:signal peptide peptidase SppA